MGGLFTGVLLSRLGWDVTIYERSTGGLSGRGAGLVAQPEVMHILAEIGADAVARTGVVAHERITFDRAGNIIHRMATPQSQISWDLLYEAFHAQLPDKRYLLGHEAAEVWQEEDKAFVRFHGGKEDSADLVIGADGISSEIRSFVAHDTAPKYAGYAAFRGLAPETELPRQSAEILSGRFSFYNHPGGQVLGYLVAGSDGSIHAPDRRYNWVWHHPLSEAELREALTDVAGQEREYSLPPGSLSKTTIARLHADARELLPPVFGNVVLKEQRPFIQGIFDYETPTMRKGNVILLGDAAFVVRPHTAMGVSKAAGDALTLRDCLQQHSGLEQALHAYASIRETEGRQIAAYGQRLGSAFGVHSRQNASTAHRI